MPHKDPEKRKAYNQTPARKKSRRICKWKSRGIIVDDNDWDYFYDYYLSVTNCQICKKELTEDRYNTHSTRAPHHDHNILDKPNVIAICCHACNANDKSRNTSGEPNIRYIKKDKCWCFQKLIQGKHYFKSGFKTKQEAIDYKLNFLLKLRMEPPNEGEDHKIQ